MTDNALDSLSRLFSTARAGDRSTLAREAAEFIRHARSYRWVGLYDVTDTEVAAIAWTGDIAPAFPRFPRTKGLNGAAVATGEIVISQDVTRDPRYLTAFPTTGSEAIIPVLSGNLQVVGTLDVESDRPNAFSPDDEDFLRRCAVALAPLWQPGWF
jgi:GAF domain-containing protein